MTKLFETIHKMSMFVLYGCLASTFKTWLRWMLCCTIQSSTTLILIFIKQHLYRQVSECVPLTIHILPSVVFHPQTRNSHLFLLLLYLLVDLKKKFVLLLLVLLFGTRFSLTLTSPPTFLSSSAQQLGFVSLFSCYGFCANK